MEEVNYTFFTFFDFGKNKEYFSEIYIFQEKQSFFYTLQYIYIIIQYAIM